MLKLFSLFSLALLLLVQSSFAQDPLIVQGVAIDSKGNPLPDGEKNITFNVYDGAKSTTLLWTEQQKVTIKGGLFSVELGLINSFDLPLGKSYWLGMRIGEDEELSPRILIKLDDANTKHDWNKEIATGVATTLAANTLDEAYDGGGVGLGRTITADQGAVNIAGPDGLTVEGAIGIGTTNPTQLLEIRKNALGVRMLVRNEGGGGGAGFEFIDDLSGADWKIKATQFGGFKIRDQANQLDVMGFDTNGNVGIGTLDPSAKFDVVGNTELNGDVDINSNLDVDGGTFHVDGANDRIGIGTTTPNEQLEITGNLRLPSTSATTGIIFSAGDTFIHNFGTRNFFAGVDAGNLTLSGLENTATGSFALADNTTGNYNTASGTFALDGNTTGSYNTALGSRADVGSGNLTNATAIGALATVTASNSLVLGNNANVGIGTTNPTSKLQVEGNVDINSDLDVDEGTLHVDGTNDRVGIGTTTPGEQLEITKNFRLPASTATTGIIFSGDNPFIHNFGTSNFFAGVNAGNLTLSGFENMGVGGNALERNTIGTFNTASGRRALQHNTTGSGNTASGANALERNTTGSNNTAVGSAADVGSDNLTNATAIGANALVTASNSLVLGNNTNVGIGTTNPTSKLQVEGNVDINSDLDVDDGTLHVDGANDRVGIGTTTPAEMLELKRNSINGGVSMRFDSFGNNGFRAWNVGVPNTGIGTGGTNFDFVIKDETGGSERMLIAFDTGNVGIGTTAPGQLLQVGTNTAPSDGIIRVGHKDGSTNRLWDFGIGNSGLFGHNDNFGFKDLSGNTIMVLQATGQGGGVGIGTTAPTHRLHVNGVARSTQSTWATSSDRRVKKNIATLNGSLSKLLEINPVTFEYTEDYKNGNKALDGLRIGFIAQDIKEVMPEMVTTTSESFGDKTIKDFHILDSSNLVPMLVGAIKELKSENKELKAKIAELDEMKAKVDQLESTLLRLVAVTSSQ